MLVDIQDLQSNVNLVFTFCNLDAYFGKFTKLTTFDVANISAVISRVGGLFSRDLWTNAACITDGFNESNGKTWEDAGSCTSFLISSLASTFLG